jgi:SAM-dependent methyltransferase
MHKSSSAKMKAFREKHLAGRESKPLVIYDLGSQDVNGSYRPIFAEPAWRYVGLDMSEGKNVDIVLRTPYVWRETSSNSADVVISGQAFEHIRYFWITMLEIARVLKPGGICCIIAPSSGPEHRYPTDCWRFYPDGMSALAAFVKFEVLENSTEWTDNHDLDSSPWHDSLLVCRKPDNGIFRNMRSNLKRTLQHRLLTLRLG